MHFLFWFLLCVRNLKFVVPGISIFAIICEE